jgi:hypothetical protein
VAPPYAGETSLQYRKRLLQKFLPLSATFKDSSLNGLDAVTLTPLEDRVYADAIQAANNAHTGPGIGPLFPHRYRDD